MALSGTFVDLKGRAVQLRKRVAEGRGADIFALADDNSRVAKIYHMAASDREARFRAMINNAPPDASLFCKHSFVCWPEELIHDRDENFIGFVMPRIRFDAHRPLLYFCDLEARKALSTRVTWPYLIRIAINLCGVFEAVHSQGHVVGDINESNLLVSDIAGVTLMDCDSIQIQDNITGVRYRRLLGHAEFTAPEIQGEFGEVDREASHDSFALAVTIFMLLMEGVHPFEGIWQAAGSAPTLDTNIREGRFAYKKGGGLVPSPAALAFEVLPPVLRSMFERCFVDGHRDPAARPSAWDWHHALKQCEHQLQSCDNNPQHLYSAHLDRCPWCVRLAGRASVNSQPAGEATPAHWRLKSAASIGMRTSARTFFLNSQDPTVGRWSAPAHSRMGADLLVIIVIGLIGAAGLLYALSRWSVDSGSAPSVFPSSARSVWSDLLQKLSSTGWKMPDLSTQARADASGVRFDQFLLCQDVDKTQKPIGAASSFRQADIRKKGLGAYIKYSAPRSARADVTIKWSSLAGAGASGPHPLPNAGPLFLRLGKDFSPGSYSFSVVVDGVEVESERVTIASK